MNPPDAEITELPSSPGARLKREREASGMTEQQAAEALNLDPAVITLLEANDFAALGAPVFAKGHLRRYAAMLGLDEEEIIGAYERSKQHVDEPTLVPKSRLEMAPVRGDSRWPLVVGGAVAFVVAALAIAYLSENGLPWSRSSDATNAAVTLESDGDSAVQATPAEVPAATDAATPAVTDAAPPAAVDGAAPPAAPVTAAAPGQVTLQLKFTEDSWVEVFDGSGKAVLYDLGKSGSERTIAAAPPLSVTLGNAPAVTIVVNGRAVPRPPTQGTLARFSVGADGMLH
jgi:cytoskeleton protein RodZ